MSKKSTHVSVAIVGSGFAGIGMGIRLKQKGINDFILFERANDVGGVWRENTYPGCACDVQSHLYSLSFAKNPGWSRSYSPQPEIWDYLKRTARDFGILPHVRFGHTVESSTWDEKEEVWRIETSHGSFTANTVVGAMGGLSEPSTPSLPGLDRFKGETFHSARWNHDYDLKGKTVAVIGTGASAIQFVPAIQPKVGTLRLFQRTPPWILPRRDHAIGPALKNALTWAPAAQWLVRGTIYAFRELTAVTFLYPQLAEFVQTLALRHMKKAVKDRELRKKLTPNYTIGCKRILLSDDYYPAVAKKNVELITDSIQEIKAHSIVTADGKEHSVDAIIFGTGFEIQDFPFAKRVRGRDGILLSDTWQHTMTAHLGTTVSGYPNLFLLQGPNTGLGHTSVITMIEAQIEHVVNALGYMQKHRISAIEPRREVQEAFVAVLDRKMAGTVWKTGGCKSWYLDKEGRNSTLWPSYTFAFKWRVQPFNASEYILVPEGRARREQAVQRASTPAPANAGVSHA